MIPTPPSGAHESHVGRTVGRYRLLRLLGQGGMGAVYAAEDPTLGRRVALKLLPEGAVAVGERRARFLREARGAAAATHENIAAVYEVGEADGTVFLAMELVPGRTLRDAVGAHPDGLPLSEVIRVGRAIATGLSRAHEAGVIHRDLKPENVMLGDEEQVKILDFGLAKLRGEGPSKDAERFATQEGRIVGTPHYMSPEQAAGCPVDERSDLFSLGIVLFEMATGRRPFEGETAMLALVAITRDAPAPPSSLRPDLPPALGELILGCLEKDAASRPPSARAVAQALAGIGGASPGPPSIAPGRGRAAPAPASIADALTELDVRSAPPSLRPAAKAAEEPATHAPTVYITPVEQRAANEARAAERHRRDGRRGLVGLAAALLVGAAALSMVDLATKDAAGPSPSGTEALSASATPAAPALRLRRLTSNPAEIDVDGGWFSADRKSFVYTADNRVFRQALAGGAREPVAVNGVASARMVVALPGDDLLVAGAGADGLPGLWRVSARGGSTRIRDAFPHLFRPSPDGSLLAVEREDGLHVESLDGGESRRVRALDGGRGERIDAIAWSPDGRALAIAVRPALDQGAPALEIVDAASGGSVEVLREARLMQVGATSTVAWLGAGRLLYALTHERDEDPGTSLYTISLDAAHRITGEPRRVHDFPGQSVHAHGYDPAARRLLVHAFGMQTDVLTAAISGGGRALGPLQRVTMDDRNDRPAGWLADGRVLFASDRAGGWDIFAARVGAEPEPLLAGPLWETWPVAAGDALLAFGIDPRSESGRCPVLRREPAGDVRLLFEARCETTFATSGRPPPAGASVACFHHTPERCLLRQADERFTLIPFDARTGERAGPPFEVAIPAASDAAWAISPDDHEIALTLEGGRIAIAPLNGGAARTLTTGLSFVQYTTWDPTGSAVLVSGMAADPTFQLVRVERGGRVDRLLDSDTRWISQPHVSPDGRVLVVGLTTMDADIWSLEGL
jgi:hypothetical protein